MFLVTLLRVEVLQHLHISGIVCMYIAPDTLLNTVERQATSNRLCIAFLFVHCYNVVAVQDTCAWGP